MNEELFERMELALRRLLATADDLSWLHMQEGECWCKGCSKRYAREVLQEVDDDRH